MAKANLIASQAKQFLRRTLLLKRKSQSGRRLNRLSRSAVGRLCRSREFRSARVVALFLGFGSEVRTHELVRRAFRAKKTVLIPDLKDGWRDPRFVRYRKHDRLVKTRFGPNELAARRGAFPASRVDLVVVPGLSFDRKGHRLGFGGGVYDRFLARTRQAALAGLYYSFQESVRLPRERHDRPLDVIFTDKEAVRCG